MVEVGKADRERLLRSKGEKLSDVVKSRKRKLREIYAISEAQDAIPNLSFATLDAPPTTTGEATFLELSDILQNRLFNEINLPARRQLRSNTSKQSSPIRKAVPEARPTDASRKAAKVQREAPRTRKSRANSPGARNDAGQATAGTESAADQEQSKRRSTSTGSQTDLPAEETAVLNEIIEETFDHATHRRSESPDDNVPLDILESEEVRAIESPRSSGVDPRRVIPISAEDAAHLPGPLVDGLNSHGGHHKAATVHLPPKEVQERHLREARKAREQKEHLSINLPPRDHGRGAEPLSSPDSTIDAHSATTPALHDASTDTSPDNESSRYEPDRLENKEDDVQTPIEFRKTPEELAQKEEHDRILKAQMDISSAEILRSSPIGADDQLRMEDQAASLSDEHPLRDNSRIMDSEDAVDGQERLEIITKQAHNVAWNIREDGDEIQAAPTPKDVTMSGVEEHGPGPKGRNGKEREVADSEAEDQRSVVDAMDVDPTIQDSFESSVTVENRHTNCPLNPEANAPATSASHSKKSSVTPTSSTSQGTSSTPAAAPPALERMTTRVQSGAMRQRSVTEILSEIDKPNTSPSSERSGQKGATESSSTSHSPSRSTTPQSPSTRVRSLLDKAKERERSKLSTVIFSKDKARPSSSNNALIPSREQPTRDANGDYFMPLFLATASTDKRGVPSLDNLLQTAHKTITTSNAYIPISENQTAKVLRRIYNLQSSGKWSLRQPKRQVEPNRQETHWDVLLGEAKWMRTDFREERKWKMAAARSLAHACAEWVFSDPEDRKLLQVNAVLPKPVLPTARSSNDALVVDENRDLVNHTPDLVLSGEADSLDEFDEEPHLSLEETVAPTAIFTLQDDDIVFGLRRSPITDKLLNELPMYGAPLAVPTPASADSLDPERFWKKRALPLSKFVEGRMELKSQPPPRKKSRFEYDEEDDDDDHVVFGEQGTKRPILPPEQTDVALFNPEHKHTRDRIHAGHQFRPPSEYPMPLQSFFECRTASQWTWAEDDELKALVREYSYNWSLISSMLTSRSLFSSGAERRTPWECFERWISLEGLPADMQKTQYFRAYNNRLEAANRNVTAQAVQAPQQVNGQGVVQAPRRRSTISFRVERRRQQKHLTLVDAMRKLAKKRETSIQKQQHAAGLAAMRKAQEVHQPRAALHTPQDFSKLKFEREERMKEQMVLYQQRQEAQRRAAMQARIAGQTAQPLPNGATPQQRGQTPANGTLPPNPNGTPTQSNQNLTVPGQNRARGPMPPQIAGQGQMPNGLRVPQSMMNGVPQAQMQAMQGGQLPMPNPALDVGLVARAHNISEQQRQAIRMQQAGQLPIQGQNGQIHNSPPRNMTAMSPPNFPQMANGNMLPFNPNNANGVSSPGPSPQGQAGSPRMGQLQQLSNGMVPQALRLEESIRQKYPNATQEQVMRMISETLAKSAHQRQGLAQSAMNAAAGGNMNGMVNGQAITNMNGGQGQSPQLYAQMLRQHQENQQKAQAQAAAQAQVVQAQVQAVQAQAAAAQSQQANTGQGHQRSPSAASGK